MTRGQKKTALIGGGGHALSLLQLGLPVDGYVDRQECPGLKGRLPWLGDDAAFLASCSPDDWRVHIAIVGGSGKEMGYPDLGFLKESPLEDFVLDFAIWILDVHNWLCKNNHFICASQIYTRLF